MIHRASRMTKWAALMLLAGAPLALAPAGLAQPPRTLPFPEVEQPGKGEKPKDIDKPLGPPPKLGGPMSPGRPLSEPAGAVALDLVDVLASVDRHYPQIRAAEQERLIAAGRQMSARGAFDVNLTSRETFQDGTYDSQRYSLGVEQLSPLGGLSYFAGYRLGSGDYPVYYGDRKTADGGELRAGVSLPLLRNREVDRARANVAKADLDRRLAEPSIQLQRIDISRAASRAYWAWVAAGHRLRIVTAVLRLAEQRDRQLQFRVEKAKNLAPIEREDNRRAIVERQARLVVATRQFEQAGIALSLYLRGPEGAPLLPPSGLLPALVEPDAPPDAPTRQRQLEEAALRRPELQTLALQRRKVAVDLELAENQQLPGLNVGASGATDLGFGKRSPQSSSRLDRQSAEIALVFDVPLQRRDARGKALEARAELARIAAREQLARDRIQLEVQDALNAMDRAYELLRRGRDNRLQAAYLQEAELRQFNVGKSDLFRVNLRELVAAEARLLEIDAAAELYRALADYVAALGLAPVGGPEGITFPNGTPCAPPG